MNFKLKLYCNIFGATIPMEADLVMVDPEDDEIGYVGCVRDYSIAQEIVKRWNEFQA